MKPFTITAIAALCIYGAAAVAAVLPQDQSGKTRGLQGVAAHTEKITPPPTTAKLRHLHQLGLLGSNSDLKPDYQPLFKAPTAPTHTAAKSRNVMHRSLLNPRGSVYAIVPRHDSMTDINTAFMGSLDIKSGVLTPMFYGGMWNTAFGDDYVYQACGFRDGKIYQASLTSDVSSGLSVSWQEIDPATGIILSQKTFPFDMLLDPYQICYVPDEDLFYCLCMQTDAGASHLVTIDPKTYKLDYIDNIGKQGYVAGLGYDPTTKTLYAFNEKNEVYSVEMDHVKHRVSLVYNGTIETPHTPFQEGFAAQLCYSPMDEGFVVLARDAEIRGTRILLIDPNAWESPYEYGVIEYKPTPYIAAIYCPDELADQNAPDPVADLNVSFTRNQLTGTVSFTAPTLTYYGVEITDQNMAWQVLCDGVVAAEGTVAPGGAVATPVTTTQGRHTFTATCSLGGLKGPSTRRYAYAGNDNPKMPTNIKLVDNKLSWTAPGSAGAHEGYVDTDMLEYDVYIDGIQQNANPIETTSYTIRIPAQQARKEIKVVATSRGLSSEPGRISAVIGNGLKLPISLNPTREQSALFQPINANNDERAFSYFDNGEPVKYGWVLASSYVRDADDWLILPAIEFPTVDNLYKLEYELRSYWNKGSVEDIDIFIGKHPNVEAMTNCIYNSIDNALQGDAYPQVVDVNFGVPEAGKWYIGIHCKSTKKNAYKGIILNNFAITSLSGAQANIPAAPTNVSITPAPEGELAAEVALTMPKLDIIGRELPADQKVTIRVNAGAEDLVLTGLPGETKSGSISVPGHGFHHFNITPYRDFYDGMTYIYKRYIGYDLPLPPTNIRHTIGDDNKTMHITWDAPGETGLNGGYVDPTDIIYEMHMVFGGTNYQQFDNSGKNCYYDLKISEDKLTKYTVVPVATNLVGKSSDGVPTSAVLGKPHEVPLVEEYPTTGFSLGTCYYENEGEFRKSMWGSTGFVESLGIGSAKVVGGIIYAYSDTRTPCPAGIKLGKITTKDCKALCFNLKYFDYAVCPNFHVDVFCSDNQQWRTVQEFTPARYENGQWAQASVVLDETMLNKPWIEFRVVADLQAPAEQAEYFVIENWSITSNAEIDLKLSDIEGLEDAVVGNDADYTVTVVNAGSNRLSGEVTVSLLDEAGKTLDSQTAKTSVLRTNGIWRQKFTFPINGEYADVSKYTVNAEVKADGDEVESNNVRTLNVKLHRAQVPTVNTLEAAAANEGTAVALTWQTPNRERGTLLDFEIEQPYLNDGTMGEWLNIDMDKFTPVGIGTDNNQISWPGFSAPSAWTVINPSEVGFVSDDRFNAHSGKHYVLARAAYLADPNEAPKQSSDWLISPEVVGGSKISFWYNTISGTDKEYVELWYSTTGTNIAVANADATDDANTNGDFKKIRTFSKIGSEAWEQCSATLPKNAKHFALVFRSWNTSGAMLDDIFYTAATPYVWDIDHYSLWRSSEGNAPECVAESLNVTDFTDSTFKGRFGHYYVLAHVKYGDRVIAGPISNLAKVGDFSGVAGLGTLTGIEGLTGAVRVKGLAGSTLNIYTADGRLALSTLVDTDSAEYPLAAGVYFVTANGAATPLLVK